MGLNFARLLRESDLITKRQAPSAKRGDAWCTAMLVAVGVLSFARVAPVYAQEAPMLIEPQSKAAQSAGTGAGVGESVLDEIRGNPAVMAMSVGRAAAEQVIEAQALSIELPGSGETLIFDDLVVEPLESGGYALYSQDRQSSTTLTLVVMGEDVIGTLHHDGATYEVQPLGGGLTAVYLYDDTQSRSPPLINDVVIPDIEPGAAAAAPERAPLAQQGDDDAIDVLVAYSANVKRTAANIDARVALLLLQTHLAYANSGIDTRVRVVHSYETSYVPLAEANPNSTQQDLSRLQASADGFADEAHGLRERYGADIVALLFQHSGRFCGGGITYQFPHNPLSDMWADWAFMVSGLGDVASGCIEDDGLTFVHEIGHLQGAEHNPEDPTTTANRYYTYGHGNCNAATGWRTVMAYDTNGRCPKQIPYFSSPVVLYQGTPTGDAALRDVARLINETSDTVADHRAGAAVAVARTHRLPLFVSASHATLQGFARVINRSGYAGEVAIHAVDDTGQRFGPVTLSLGARETKHFNSIDLRDGAPSKGLTGQITGVEGDNLRLELDSELDIEPLAYTRPRGEGSIASTHDVAAGTLMRWYVPMFNPGNNARQVSSLRVVNISGVDTEIRIEGIDDDGDDGAGVVRFDLPGDEARTLSAKALEEGYSESVSDFEFEGSLGDGAGKWQLFVSADRPVQVVSLLHSATGDLTNLSTVTGVRDPRDGAVAGDHLLPLIPPASDTRQGFVRIINRSNRPGTVRLHGVDDAGQRHGPATLAIGALATRHLNSQDLEDGNTDKGLTGSFGDGTGNWRLELDTTLDIEPLAYIRTPDGFLTSAHEVVAETVPGSKRYEVAVFNPSNNTAQKSLLRVANTSAAAANVSITGQDDEGDAAPGGAVTFSVPANEAGTLSAQALEQGYSASESDFDFTGSFGDGSGKWQLTVSSDQQIGVMSLLSSGGKLTNLSTVTADGTIRGTDGGDVLYGTSGSDVINPLDNGTSHDLDEDRGYDTIFGSRGDDTIIYTDSGAEAYQEVDYSELGAVETRAEVINGIRAIVDGPGNRATVGKGSAGADTFVDVARAMDSDGGLGLIGTGVNDEFHVTVGDGQFVNVDAGPGFDHFRLRLIDSGWVRVSYVSAPAGVEVDLVRGRAQPDGHGAVDVFFGDIPRGVAGSEHSDEFLGSDRDEVFFGRAGNDVIDGGGGFDRVDFGYNSRFAAYVDVRNLEVDLNAGTATGTWNGTPFSYSISNIESIWGGSGDDLIRGSIDEVRGSPGDDRIVFTDSNRYARVRYGRLPPGGITATLDGRTGLGSIDKGSLGTDTIEGLAGLFSWNGGGFGFDGTNSDDVFNITMGNEQWMQVAGGAGNDTFNIQIDADATVRVDYRVTQSGINVDLGAGRAHDDGFGDVDTINGNIFSIRGSDFTDVIYGSGLGEEFIGRTGDDIIDGRGGSDTLRFIRSDTSIVIRNLHIDLSTGRASGSSTGQAFSYTISNIENARGSHWSDILRGDNGDNRLRGYGGNDEIDGRGGNDRLQGHGGRDLFIFQAGHGNDRIDDFTNSSDTIVLMGLNVTASDVLANAGPWSEGTGVWIDLTSFGGGNIDLHGFSFDDLDATDFRIEN